MECFLTIGDRTRSCGEGVHDAVINSDGCIIVSSRDASVCSVGECLIGDGLQGRAGRVDVVRICVDVVGVGVDLIGVLVLVAEGGGLGDTNADDRRPTNDNSC